jgi:hypothetical protein
MKTSNIQTGDQAAKAISDVIIKWKLRLATALNRRINRLPRRRQKGLLLAFCCLFLAGELVTLFGNGKAIGRSGSNYLPAHIGQSSLSINNDSVQIKNQAHGKSTADRVNPGKK